MINLHLCYYLILIGLAGMFCKFFFPEPFWIFIWFYIILVLAFKLFFMRKKDPLSGSAPEKPIKPENGKPHWGKFK